MKTNICSVINKTAFVFSILSVLLLAVVTSEAAQGTGGGGGGKATETAINNLSFPVIWAEEVAKDLPGLPGMDPVLNGTFWYQWGFNGVDPNVTPASCPPDPDENDLTLNPEGTWYCDDDKPETLSILAGSSPATTPLPLAKAYLQKDQNNVWQAGTANPTVDPITGELAPVEVNWIDWGDNLESVDWYTRSQIRLEVVLFKDLTTPMTEYEMRHTSGWGTDEVHGLAVTQEGISIIPGAQATVYSHCARLTVQKLLVRRESPLAADLMWDSTNHEWTGDGLINKAIFNESVFEGEYSAETNVKGRIIYGYTWNVRRLNDMTGETAAGDYRITFSLDDMCGTVNRNTTFEAAEILIPSEEEVEAAILALETTSTDEGGGKAVIYSDPESGTKLNVSYIDVRILDRTGGGGGGNR